MLEEGDYQTEIPEAPEPWQPPGWLKRILEWLGDLFSGVGGAGVIEIFFWIVAAVVVAFLLRWLVGEWRYRRRTPAKEKADFDETPVPGLGPLPDPEAFAGGGDFAAAVRALLLHAQQVLVQRRKFDLRAALTSREILNRAEINDRAEEELRGLVLAVEVSHFGGAEVERLDYDRCRERYSRFVAAVDGGSM